MIFGKKKEPLLGGIRDFLSDAEWEAWAKEYNEQPKTRREQLERDRFFAALRARNELAEKTKENGKLHNQIQILFQAATGQTRGWVNLNYFADHLAKVKTLRKELLSLRKLNGANLSYIKKMAQALARKMISAERAKWKKRLANAKRAR